MQRDKFDFKDHKTGTGYLLGRNILATTISIYFCLFLFISAFSQNDSLLNYLEIAARNNPVVLQKFYEYQAAIQKVPQIGSLPDPELSAGVFLKPMEIVNGNQIADIRLMQMFPWFGVLKSARDEMSLMAKSKFELFRDAKLQVYYDVQRLWYELYKVRVEIEISERNIEILKKIEQLSLVKYHSGSLSGNPGSSVNMAGSNMVRNTGTFSSSGMQGMSGTANSPNTGPMTSSQNMQSGTMGSSSSATDLVDLYRIQIEIGELENNIYLLKSKCNTIIAEFNSDLNRSPVTQVFTPERISADTSYFSLSTFSDSILTNNPMLKMLEFEEQSLAARKKMVRNMGLPMVGIGLNYSLIGKNEMQPSSMNGKDMIMPMIAVNLPVYRKKYNAMVKEADLLKEASASSYQVINNSLHTELFKAIQQYREAVRRIILYKKQSDLASRSLDISIRSYTASTVTLIDLLRIRQQTFEFEIRQQEALADLNTSVALLNRITGTSLL